MPAAPIPVRILITVGLLAVYCALAGWIALSQHLWLMAVVAAVAAVACAGTVMLKRWSQWLVYLLMAALLVTWGHSVYAAYAVGLLRLLSGVQLARLFAPDGVLVLLSCYCSYAVFRQFAR